MQPNSGRCPPLKISEFFSLFLEKKEDSSAEVEVSEQVSKKLHDLRPVNQYSYIREMRSQRK